MKKNLLILIALLIATISYSQTVGDTFIENSILYKITSITPNTVQIENYNSTTGGSSVIIPATANYNTNIYSVTSIAVSAFDNKGLTSVTIPNSVTSIGAAAFSLNPALTCVISEATTPAMIVSTVNDSFGIDRDNIDLSIPAGTASAYTTAQWTGFNSVAEGLTGTFVVDNITYQINPTPNNEVTITDYNTAGGTDVTIPAIVSSACTEFSVTTIGGSAFENKGLTNVVIPNSIFSIGYQAFQNNNLTTLSIPDSVTELLGSGGHFADNQLVSVVISNGLTEIPAYAFGGNQLTNITIPNNITIMKANAFQNNQLTGFTLSDNITTIENGVFKYNQLTNISIPNTIVTIGNAAFEGNQLTDVTFPNSIVSIDNFAFYDNPLSSVTSESTTPPIINNSTFGADRSMIHLHIPPNTTGAYVNDTGALWTGFNPVTEDATLSTSNFELVNDIKVFNTSEELNVISSGTAILESYTIYSISGTKIKEGIESAIAIETMSSGIYILELTFNTGKLVKKFAK